MATISKHGEIGQIEYLAYRACYCEDGQILRNQGDGWKVWKKLKPEFMSDPKGAFERASHRQSDKLRERPAFRAWRDTLHELVAFRHRWFVVETIRMMPSDPDGVWSTFDDHKFMGVELDLDDCVKLCRAYESACAEAKEFQPGEPVAA